LTIAKIWAEDLLTDDDSCPACSQVRWWWKEYRVCGICHPSVTDTVELKAQKTDVQVVDEVQ
jgi:hypothetical protein